MRERAPQAALRGLVVAFDDNGGDGFASGQHTITLTPTALSAYTPRLSACVALSAGVRCTTVSLYDEVIRELEGPTVAAGQLQASNRVSSTVMGLSFLPAFPVSLS